jgi:hypothetical protein
MPARSRGVERRQSKDRLGGSGRTLRWWKSLDYCTPVVASPAVEAGIADHIWTISELLSYAAYNSQPNGRRHKKIIDETRLTQLAENYRFFGDMRFKQLTLFIAAMTAVIGGIFQASTYRWWLAVAGLFITGVMWVMEVRSTMNAVAIHDALLATNRDFFPTQRKFWPWLNASFAVLLLHVAFYVFWLLCIRAWCPTCCIWFCLGMVIG